MKTFSKNALIVFILALSTFFVACEEENHDAIVETEEPIEVETSMKITLRGSTTTVDAFASYCEDNDRVFLAVSNKEELLDTALTLDQFEADDFLLYFAKDESGVASIGGAAFADTLGGTAITSTVLDAAANINIIEANSDIARGNMDGSFALPSGAVEPYSVEFVADVVQTSPFCN
jgi:hypothetical protein